MRASRSKVAADRARAVFDNLRRGGRSADQIARLAERAMVRLYERDQSGAHLWGLVRNIARA